MITNEAGSTVLAATASISTLAGHLHAESRNTMHRLKNRALGIALGGAALGGLVFAGCS